MHRRGACVEAKAQQEDDRQHAVTDYVNTAGCASQEGTDTGLLLLPTRSSYFHYVYNILYVFHLDDPTGVLTLGRMSHHHV